MRFLAVLAIMVTMFGAGVKDSVEIWSMTITHTDDEVVYCVDENGHEWSFYGTGYKGGQVLVVLQHGEIINAF